MAARETAYQNLPTAQRLALIALAQVNGPSFAQFRGEDALKQQLCVLADEPCRRAGARRVQKIR